MEIVDNIIKFYLQIGSQSSSGANSSPGRIDVTVLRPPGGSRRTQISLSETHHEQHTCYCEPDP